MGPAYTVRSLGAYMGKEHDTDPVRIIWLHIKKTRLSDQPQGVHDIYSLISNPGHVVKDVFRLEYALLLLLTNGIP